MKKAECSLLCFWQIIPVATHGFEQVKGAYDVGLNKHTRPVNRTIHMAFGGEIDDGTWFGVGQQVGDEIAITDVAVDELVTRIAIKLLEVLEVTGVGQQVEVNDGFVTLLEPVEDEVRADETGGTSNKNRHNQQNIIIV